MSNNDQALIAALREAGHTTAADHVRDSALAGELESAGHADLAAGLKAKLAPTPNAPAQSAPTQSAASQQADREAEVVLAALKRDTGIDLRNPDN